MRTSDDIWSPVSADLLSHAILVEYEKHLSTEQLSKGIVSSIAASEQCSGYIALVYEFDKNLIQKLSPIFILDRAL